MGKQSIHLSIKNKDENIFEGDVMGLSAYNEVGLFDILPMHSNFITLIKNKIIIHLSEGDRELKIGNGVLKVEEGKVGIYLGL